MLLQPSNKHSLVFVLPLVGVYALLLGILMGYHELWRDETQAWMVAKASITPFDIFANNKYEGHPPLWALIIWPFTYFFDNPEWIKVPHWILATITAFFVARFAPFPKWVVVALLFSYYFLYEYATLSRNYQIGILGIVSFLSFYREAIRRPWVGLVCLSLAVWANIYAMMVASVLSLFYLKDLIIALRELVGQKYKWQVGISAGVFLLGLVSMVVITKPPADGSFIGWNFNYNPELITSTFTAYFRTLLPIPHNTLNYWNSSVFQGDWLPWAGLLLVVLVLALFYKHPQYLALLGIAVLVLFSFQYAKYVGFLRHSGHHWLAIIGVLWLLVQKRGWHGIGLPLQLLMGSILVVHLAASTLACQNEVRYTFSGGGKTAAFIQAQNMDERTIIGHADYSVSSVAAFLNKPIYYTVSQDSGTYIKWTLARKHDDIHAYLQSNKDVFAANPRQYLLVTSFPLSHYDWLSLAFDSGETVVWDERLFVYTITP